MLSPLSQLDDELQVRIVDAYGDGTIWISLTDSHERFATACIDGRVDSPTRFRLFDQARHPRDTNAKLIGLGTPEEGVVIPLISNWISSGGLDGFTDYGSELFLNTFNRYGEPQPTRVDNA